MLGRLGGRSYIDIIEESGNVIFEKHPDTTADFEREREALEALKSNSRIVRLEFVDSQKKVLGLKQAPGESLDELTKYDALKEWEINLIIKEIAEVLEFMHSKESGQFVHYDLSASNIFWDRDSQEVTVIDFGTSYKLDSIPNNYLKNDIGTPLYMSPEKINRKPQLGTQADIFSLGVLWYEMLTGGPPFNPDVGNLRTQILSEEPVYIKKISEQLNSKVLELLAKDPMNRPTASQLVQWFNTLSLPKISLEV